METYKKANFVNDFFYTDFESENRNFPQHAVLNYEPKERGSSQVCTFP
jgi:hypothetical protein